MHNLILITLSLILLNCSSNQSPVRMVDTNSPQYSEIHQADNSSISTRSTPPANSPTLKTALVIGNSDYRLMPLVNPENDATDIAAKLKAMDFQVIFATNKNKVEVKELIRKFGSTLKQRGGVGVFFYAGHGLQIDGKNYLVPTDFNVAAAYEVSDAAIDISLVTGAMEEANNPLNIIVLDACRDNPYPRKNRSSTRGLARIISASGTIIAYSTGPGNVAADGEGRNSPYTQYLLKHMDTQGITIEQVFKRVRVDVENSTQGKQLPWETSSLRGDFYFKPGSILAPLPPLYTPPPLTIVKPQQVNLLNINARKLSIYSNPAGSTITLLNSDTTYSRGVQLAPGNYQIAVSKAGYITKKQWITIDKDNVDIQITLVPDYNK